MADTNLAPIPDAWGDWAIHPGKVTYGNPDNPQIVWYDTNVLHDGHPSIRIDGPAISQNGAREINCNRMPINPGDHVVWIVLSKANPDPPPAGRGTIIGADLYGPSGRLFEVTRRTSGDPFYHMNDSSKNRWDSVYVPYGSDWTWHVLDFIVPVVPFTETDYGVPVPPQYATAYIPWMTVDWNPANGTNSASGWFTKSELYVNPPTPNNATILLLLALGVIALI